MLRKQQKTIKFTSQQIAFLEELAETNRTSIAEENRKIIDLYRHHSLYDTKALAEIAKTNESVKKLHQSIVKLVEEINEAFVDEEEAQS